MADLFAISDVQGEVAQHVILFHGLGGHPHNTWRSLTKSKICWPQWLAEDIEGLAVRTVGYDAAVSRWHGSAMPLPDRATNVLERILAEPKLQTGEIILIGHSFGGLVIKQLLRTAESMALQREDAANFIRRVRRVAFLATPHSGAELATWGDRLRIFIWPSAATACLVRNDPNLRDLNLWYREWSTTHHVEHLILTESRPTCLCDLIVKPDSSDPELSSRPIPIDANHKTICKPKDRSSEIYVHIRNFITCQLDTAHRETVIINTLKTQSSQLEALVDATQESRSQLGQMILDQGEKTADVVADRLQKDISQIVSPSRKYPKELVDNEIQKHLSIMRQARFFGEFSVSEHSIRLAEKILSGEFEGGSDRVKSSALALCARFLAYSEKSAQPDELLSRARQLGNGPEITLAEAFRISANGNFEEALSKLASVASSNARSAAFIIVTHHKGADSAIEWLSKSGITHIDLDADGKFFLIRKLLELGRWDLALEHANALHEEDFQQAPVLFQAAAMANLMQATPGEYRSFVLEQVPFVANTFPLASNEVSLQARRKAQDLFSQCALAARGLGCVEAADLADDYALWLELRDPESLYSGRQKLQVSMREPTQALRRLHFALQFGIKLDLDAVEQEIERQTAISGDKSYVAAMARFALAFMQKSPKAIAAYIDRHRAQLQEHLGKKAILIFEIEMLAQAGLSQQAEERLKNLIDDGLSEAEKNQLRTIIAESTGVDPVEARKAQFESSGQLNDLRNLVNLLEQQNDWSQLCHYGSLLFERTLALPDAERLAGALHEANRYGDLAALLRKYPEFLDQSGGISP
ncbi:MAG: alpha/beta fold hydrolase [Deltaproteobacteria bacterium]|nr:alpha/beta fold hydrolase [Deltaproteobacteria bacterium]